ncbi:MAG: Flp pilus assembly complex ATPase component TadA [Catenulispora sp.]|nr:Flp pilus assembly complex ATPase component TadA [Catenulispora sp.]
MSADRSEKSSEKSNEKSAENRFGGRLRSGGHNAGRSAQGSGLRDAIAFLNRESVSLPAPEAPPWEARPNPAGTGPTGLGPAGPMGPMGPAGPANPAQHRPDPPLAPVRELRPPTMHPGPAPAPMVNGAQFPVAPEQQRPQLPQPPQHAQHPQHPQWPATRQPAGLPAATVPPPGQPAPGHQLDLRGTGRHTGPIPGAGQRAGSGTDDINAFAEIDWTAVELLRKQVRDRITEQFPARDVGTEEQRRAFGMAMIEEAVNSWYARAISRGLAPSDTQQHTMRRAVSASVFGMGRLTPLLEHPDIENIEYRGCDDGYVVYSDGRVERAPAIADSDESLLSDLQYWAAKQNRTLSANSPSLYLTLEDGARLTATIGTCKRPNLVIRRHRVVDVTLDDLVGRGMLSPAIAAFLRAAVLANCNIVVTGPLNSGKTTLLRALAAEIPPMERYATLETEYELHLDEVGRHPRMVAYQALVGTAEQGYNGRRAGEVTLTDIMEVALRMNFTRLIVGEIRGAEVVAMLEAVSTGGRGSLCTMHANSARDVFGRFVTLCTRTNMTRDSAVQLAAESLHYIVNVQMDADSAAGMQNVRSARRYVDQIVEVNGMGDGMNPSATDVFAPGSDGRAVFAHRPEKMARLQKAGFDPNWLLHGNDSWSLAGVGTSSGGGSGSGASGSNSAAAHHKSQPSPAQHRAETVAAAFKGMGMPAATGTVVGSGPVGGAVGSTVGGRAGGSSSRYHEQATPVPEQDQFDRQYLEDRQRIDRYAERDRETRRGGGAGAGGVGATGPAAGGGPATGTGTGTVGQTYDRTGRGWRSGRGDRGERGDRHERGERGERNERGERGERGGGGRGFR